MRPTTAPLRGVNNDGVVDPTRCRIDDAVVEPLSSGGSAGPVWSQKHIVLKVLAGPHVGYQRMQHGVAWLACQNSVLCKD